MNIDKMEFVAWMERIMDRLDILGNHRRFTKEAQQYRRRRITG